MDKPWLKSYDSGMPHTLSYPDCSLPTFLHESAKKFPERIAIVFFDNKPQYNELSSLVNTFASALLSIGVKIGDSVVLLLPNSPQFVIIAGDIITVDSQATIKEGDYVLDFKTSDVKQIKNKRELKKEYLRVVRRGRNP